VAAAGSFAPPFADVGGWAADTVGNVCVIGAGYVGLVTSAGLAELGHRVVVLETDASRLEALGRHQLPIHEPGLDELVERHAARGRLTFSGSYAASIPDADFIFIAVNTPPKPSGEADTAYVMAAVASLLPHARPGQVVITKSTVPVGTGDAIARAIQDAASTGVEVVSNPEFLREGTAVRDFLAPDRIVVGASSRTAASPVVGLYSSLSAPVVVCSRRSAELAKYAANALLATRISFMNEMSAICEAVDADIEEVARVVGLDQRIGGSYLSAGLGWGGSCFPKDLRALSATAHEHGIEPAVLEATVSVNMRQRERIYRRLCEAIAPVNGDGATVAVLGLAFKPNTDDVRESPAIDIIRRLTEHGVSVQAHDPVAMHNARAILGKISYFAEPHDTAENADAVFLATEWDEYRQLDWARIRELMRGRVVIDSRNALDGPRLERLGFQYISVGRRRDVGARTESLLRIESTAAGGGK
jgi:UDPglucose 6-dehydrogenase